MKKALEIFLLEMEWQSDVNKMGHVMGWELKQKARRRKKPLPVLVRCRQTRTGTRTTPAHIGQFKSSGSSLALGAAHHEQLGPVICDLHASTGLVTNIQGEGNLVYLRCSQHPLNHVLLFQYSRKRPLNFFKNVMCLIKDNEIINTLVSYLL